MDLSLEGGLKSGCWTMFGDFHNQVLYSLEQIVDIKAFATEYGVSAPPFLRNCRNTPAVTKFVDALRLPGGNYSKTLRPDTKITPEMVDVQHGNEIDELVAWLGACP